MEYEFQDFAKFLKELADPSSGNFEANWRLFDQIFTPRIIRAVEKVTRNRQYVEDIVGRLSMLLMQDDFKVIKRFRIANEIAFSVYLTTIAKRLAINYVNKEKRFTSFEYDDKENSEKTLPIQKMILGPGYFEELHKSFVNLTRSAFKSKKDQFSTERKSVITMLRYISEFPSKVVAQIPLLGLSNDHNVDVTVERFCKKINGNLRGMRDFQDKWLLVSKELIGPTDKENTGLKNLTVENKNNLHPIPGVLVGLAQFGEQHHIEVADHINDCAGCQELYNFVKESFKNGTISYFESRPKCPTTNKEIGSYVVRFLNQNVEKNNALRCYKHLNDCYSCFELLCVNWSGYMSVRESFNN